MEMGRAMPSARIRSRYPSASSLIGSCVIRYRDAVVNLYRRYERVTDPIGMHDAMNRYRVVLPVTWAVLGVCPQAALNSGAS